MFTGIVTAIGTVETITQGDVLTLEIASGWPAGDIAVGASIAHAGVCLTATRVWPGGHAVDVSPETLALTTLGRLGPGSRVNLERSLRLGDELGGHLVFGHVDGVGSLLAAEPEGDSRRLRFRAPAGLMPMVAVKGSISVEGVSLTVNAVGADHFDVMIIPHTWSETTLGALAPGDPVNLEVDMLARYVARQLQAAKAAGEEGR